MTKTWAARPQENCGKLNSTAKSESPIPYMLEGKQYISVMARGTTNNRLFIFVLDGKEPIPPIPPRP